VNKRQQIALDHHCRLAVETMHPRLAYAHPAASIVLSEGYGGPVWHASAAGLPGLSLSDDTLRTVALRALEGVGDVTLGEWEERGRKAYHVRRRLSAAEQVGIGEAVDVRGTPEAERRFEAVQRYLPPGWREIV